MDGELDQADLQEVIAKLVEIIRKVRPQVVLTFDPNGYYGHPDHIAISQFATTASLVSADVSYDLFPWPAHRVSKLYYLAATATSQDVYQQAFGDLVMNVDGVERRSKPWADWAITTEIDASAHWKTVWQAVTQHCSQLPGYQSLLDLPEEIHKELWGNQTFYRALSLVNGGRKTEHDLFEGINPSMEAYYDDPEFQNANSVSILE
jgi:LmbE family N-acetylglucosaminyl deacetylase